MEAALGDLLANAMTLADGVIAQAPDRHVPAAELARVESFVVDTVLKEARSDMEKAGASQLALALADGPIAATFRGMFAERFREQATLMFAQHRGQA